MGCQVDWIDPRPVLGCGTNYVGIIGFHFGEGSWCVWEGLASSALPLTEILHVWLLLSQVVGREGERDIIITLIKLVTLSADLHMHKYNVCAYT